MSLDPSTFQPRIDALFERSEDFSFILAVTSPTKAVLRRRSPAEPALAPFGGNGALVSWSARYCGQSLTGAIAVEMESINLGIGAMLDHAEDMFGLAQLRKVGKGSGTVGV